MKRISTPAISKSFLKRSIKRFKYPIKKMDLALRYATVSLALEGQYTTKEADDLIVLKAQGQISRETFKKRALEIALSSKKDV